MKEFLKIVGLLVVCLAFLFIFFIIYVIFSEYNPAPIESVDIISAQNASNEQNIITVGSDISVLSWNIGYGALGDNASFFMDGGKDVYTSDKKRIEQNLNEMIFTIKKINPDIICLQEIDTNSSRTYKINEVKKIYDELGIYDAGFAYNFNTSFIPYPFPPMGRIKSGLLTLADKKIDESLRVSLPCPFKIPVRYFNIKRALLVTKFPIANSDKQLFIVNLHLEAYDNGQGKFEQTKKLLEYMNIQASNGNYLIAIGDFNQTLDKIKSVYPAVSDKIWQPGEIYSDDFKDYQVLFDTKVPSCRGLYKPYIGANKADFQYYIIDGAILSKNINIKQIKTLDTGFHCSDHNPVYLEFTLQ